MSEWEDMVLRVGFGRCLLGKRCLLEPCGRKYRKRCGLHRNKGGVVKHLIGWKDGEPICLHVADTLNLCVCVCVIGSKDCVAFRK